MFFVWEYYGGITQLITFLNVVKDSVTVMGKAIPQMGPTAGRFFVEGIQYGA